ncbi:MAG: ASCH domain-containing protein [Phycisphaerae bacterium]|nr:ASCH domain-containing protein [Phycisphaerae bacterium]
MKAISVKQPWANMIACGAKTIETRTWGTSYRGQLLIVSSKTPKIEPAGFAVAVADVVDCRLMTKEDEAAACCSIYPDAHAWILSNVRRIEPIPIKGALGIYEVSVDPASLTNIDRSDAAACTPRQRQLF